MKHATELVFNYLQLMRFNRPIGILLLLWPTLTALWLAAEGHPKMAHVVIFSLGVVVMRAAGCIINDVADRKVDGHVTRTQHRPLAQKKVTLQGALIAFGFLIVCAMGLTLHLNFKTQALASIALLLAIAYPFVKRFSHYPQVVLGAAFGWAIPMAFMTEMNFVPWYGWWFFIAMLFWTVVYDTQYAMVDREDDLKIGVKSTAIAFGRYDRFILTMLQLICLIMLGYLGYALQFGTLYFLGLLFAASLAIYQQKLIKDRKPHLCFKAFLNNHYFGLSIFLGVVLDRLGPSVAF